MAAVYRVHPEDEELIEILSMLGCGEEESEEILTGERGVVECERGIVEYEWDVENEEIILRVKKPRVVKP